MDLTNSSTTSYNSTTAPGPTTAQTSTGRSRPGRPSTVAVSAAEQHIVCTVSESRGISPTVGLAFVNISTSEAVLCQICDSQTYARTVHKLAVFDPSEILFMKTSKEPRSKLYSVVEENLPQLTVKAINRRYWSEKIGHESLKLLAFEDDFESLKITLEGNYFAACCFAAVGSVF